jgi:hypothetical protein
VELDVDTPADLALLIACESRTRTQQLLSHWGVRERLEGRRRLSAMPAGGIQKR